MQGGCRSLLWVASGIITTNYDLLVEYALGTKNFNYGTLHEILIGRGPYPMSQWRYPVMVRGRPSLAKLHGSISWDLNKKYTDGRRALTGNALLVAPVREKTPPSSLTSTWQLAERILSQTTSVIFLGYAFNGYDEATLRLLKSAERVETALLIDPVPRIEVASELWPHARIVGCAPPPMDDTTISNWLEALNEGDIRDGGPDLAR
jgi:hypothetical protein